jgi:WD40-like Beta Propeller Repeat
MRRATGETYVEMYPKWIEYLKKRYAAQAVEVRRAGLREGTRITHHGQDARYPRWIPPGAWPEHQGGILYFREDEHERPGLWALDIVRDEHGAIVKSRERSADQIARTNGESYSTFLPDGAVVFSSQDFYRNVFLFGDLEKMNAGKKSPYGDADGGRQRITPLGYRSDAPTTSPDGRHVVFTRNEAGTRSIHIADLSPDGLTNARPLVTTPFMEQAFTPRYSPDGERIAYSVWKNGGYRDIRIVDVHTGDWEDITQDRAVDGAPSWSSDGRYLFFHSDRTGIMNVYAWEVATRKFFLVTNVINGAYEPEPSPDGKTLVYVGYTHEGFDLYAMPLDRATWTEAPPYEDEHPSEPTMKDRHWSVVPYNPWPTLLPRKYGVQLTQGSFGEAAIITASGSDVAGLHTIAASMVTEFEKPELQGSIGYTYSRLPFDTSVSIGRSIAPRAGFQLGTGYKPTIIQETTSFATSINYAIPRAFDTSAVSITHSLARVADDLPIPVDKLDPYETPVFPQRGLASSLQFAYSFTNAERYVWSVGAEGGETLGLTFDFTDPAIGSDFAGFVLNGDLFKYFLMPWGFHHSLALHVGGGTSGGTFPGRGAFYVGSFVDLPVVDTIQNTLIQGGITLRGYPPVAESGLSYLLGNAEYRFPIWNCDCGPSTLPVFFNRVNGALFVDYGSAFNIIDAANFKTGVGGELWFDTTLGYVEPFTFRLGYAKGLASTGIDKFYFVAAVPY